MFDYRALFVWLKYRTYLRISIPVYCFYICGSGFGVLFWSKGNIRKQNHLTKYEKVRLCSLKCVNFCWYRQRINVFFFLKTAHWYGLNYFWIITFLWDLKVQKQVWKFGHKFSVRTDINFCCFEIYDDISTSWPLIPLFNMPKGLVT